MADIDPLDERVVVRDGRRGGIGMALFGIALAIVVLGGAWYLYALERGPVTTTELVVGENAGVAAAGPVRR